MWEDGDLARANELAPELREAMSQAATRLRPASPRLAAELEAHLPPASLAPDRLEVVTLGSLCQRAKELFPSDKAKSGSVLVELSPVGPDVRVAEAGARSWRAVFGLFSALSVDEASGPTTVRAEEAEKGIRLIARSRVDVKRFMNLAAMIREIGGDAGCSQDPHTAEAWIVLPRA
jgi:hypothetical protein